MAEQSAAANVLCFLGHVLYARSAYYSILHVLLRVTKKILKSVLLLRRYVLSVLSQLATRAYSRGLIQRELQLAIVYIIGLLDVVFKIIMSDKPV